MRALELTVELLAAVCLSMGLGKAFKYYFYVYEMYFTTYLLKWGQRVLPISLRTFR